ncbi:MAG: hypothetical protein MJY88_04060 [Bacteroidales bacterium]|nr:hypothetical protein [Bacteroidales bacterium]
MDNKVLDGFLLKLGTVLSLTKDALLADFLGDMPKYVPDVSVLDQSDSYDSFKANLSKEKDKLSKFVEYLCTRLGYDLTAFEKNQQLVDLVSSIFATVDSLGSSVKTLAGKGQEEWQKEFETVMTHVQGENGEKFTTDEFFLDPKAADEKLAFTAGKQGNSLTVSFVDIEGVGDVGALITTIKDLIKLIKSFRDFEWDSIRKEYKDFGDFIESTYFNEKFAERLFDHVISVLLSKAKEVFDEEIKMISQSIGDFKKLIEDTLKEAKDKVEGTVEAAAKEIIDKINELKSQLDAIHKQLRKAAQKLYDDAKKAAEAAGKEFTRTLEDFYKEASSDLYSQYTFIQAEMSRLTKEALGDFGKVGEVLNRIHKILDLFGILKTQTIEIAKYIPDTVTLPSVDMDDVNGLLKDAFDVFPVKDIKDFIKDAEPVAEGIVGALDAVGGVTGTGNLGSDAASELGKDVSDIKSEVDKLKDINPGKIVQNAVEEAQKKTDEALAKLKSMCPTVEINVIDFSRVQQLFTKPSEYFNEVFPLKDLDDAEAILAKIYEVAKAFNASVPDFSSVSSIINMLLARIRKAIDEIVNSADKAYQEAKKEVLAKLKKVQQFILDIKKVLEAFAMEVKKQLTDAFDSFKKDVLGAADEAKGLIATLQDDILKTVNEALDEAKAKGKSLLPDTNIKLRSIPGLDVKPDTLMYQLFAEPFIKVVQQQAKEHDLFKGFDTSSWEDVVKEAKAGGDGAVALLADYKSILQEIDERVRTIFDPKTYQTKFTAVMESLKEEFESRTAGIPKDYDALKKFGTDSLDKLLKGEDLKNPFSGFDFNAYFTIVADGVKELVPTDLDAYYLKFKEATLAAVEKMVAGSSAMQGDIQEALKKAKKDISYYNDQLKSFAQDIFSAYWKELKSAVYKLVVRPLVSLVETVVRKWVRELIQKVITEVIAAVKKQALLAYDEYKDVFKEVQEDVKDAVALVNSVKKEAEAVAQDVTAMISDILMLSEKAKGISSWQDGLAFAFSVYSAIPDSVKEYVQDLIPLPKWNFDSVKLPDYKLDMKNKFLAVSLFDYSYEDKKDNHIKTGVSFQLLAFVGDKAVLKEDGSPELDSEGDPKVRSGLYLLPAINGDYNQEFNLGEEHRLELSAAASMNKLAGEASKKDDKSKEIQKALADGAIGLFVTKKDGSQWEPECEPLFSTKAIEAWFQMTFRRGQAGEKEAKKLEIYDSEVLSITMDDYPQTLYIGYKDGLDFGYKGSVKNLVFNLDLAKVNSFFEAIMKDSISFNLESLEIGYGYKDGFTFNGDASVRIPINKTIDFKAVKLDNLAIEVGLPKLRGVSLGFGTNITADLSGVKLTMADIGFALDMNLLTEDYKFGDFDISPQFKMPDGIGLSINIEGTLTGTGALKWNKETGEIMGAAELRILEMCGASALFILNSKPVDGAPFSFMGALCVFFTPSIQLGMGFSLSAIGGSLGIHRRIDTDKMRNAVKDGSLTSILFVKDLDKHLSEVLANVTSYYPVKKNQFFFGALAQLKWAEIFTIEAGLFVQAPSPVQILLAGGLHLTIAEAVDKLLAINANFLGVFDPAVGISFDAELVDSSIVGIELHGSVALRIYWGGTTKGFILSAGGFHPEYTPEPGFNVGKMKRMGLKLDYSILKLSMDSYFAVTSNTVQFGSDTRLQIGWDKFGLSGYMYYNVLFQFNPFAFRFDAGVGLAVKCGSWTLMSVGADLDVSGPAKWHIKGKASFWFILVKIKIDFSKTWGKSQSTSDKKYIDIQSLLVKSFEQDENWAVVRGDLVDGLVNIAKFEKEMGLVMNPFDTLDFNQSEVPFGTDIEKYGEDLPGDVMRIELDTVGFEGDRVKAAHSDLTSSFAPSLTKKMTDAEKLHAPSYKDVNAGFNVKVDPDAVQMPDSVSYASVLESDVQDIDPDIWAAWEKKAAGVKKKVTAASTTTEEASAMAMTKKSVRPSSRRTATGFNRYIKELDSNYTVETRIKIADIIKCIEEEDYSAIEAINKAATDDGSKTSGNKRVIRPVRVSREDLRHIVDERKLKREYGRLEIRRDKILSKNLDEVLVAPQPLVIEELTAKDVKKAASKKIISKK